MLNKKTIKKKSGQSVYLMWSQYKYQQHLFCFFGEGGRGTGQFILKIHLERFPGSPVGKNLLCNAGDIDWIAHVELSSSSTTTKPAHYSPKATAPETRVPEKKPLQWGAERCNKDPPQAMDEYIF